MYSLMYSWAFRLRSSLNRAMRFGLQPRAGFPFSSGCSAIYFSRTPLPYVRGEPNADEWLKRCDYWRHIGIYGYSAKAVARYAALPESAMERCEMLEQLRFIAAGYKFDVVETEYESIGIDTPADLAAAEEFLSRI